MRFNTALAAMMEFVNGAYKWEARPREALRPFILLLAPYAPHLGEPGDSWRAAASWLVRTGALGGGVGGGGGLRGPPLHGSIPSPTFTHLRMPNCYPPALPQRRRCGRSWAVAAAAAA